MIAPDISAVQLALKAQAARDAQRPDGEASLLASEPIAIVGMGCRFPGGADDPERLWALLDSGSDAVTRVPTSRWDASVMTDDARDGSKLLTPRAGLLDDIEGFDADFFGIAPREAVRMDPQQRLLLEVTWDALRDAGCRTEALRGSDAGVFVAIYSNDYSRSVYADWEAIDAHTASGSSHGISAGRIAYLLDLHGPAVALDTACSSSLVAVHTACRSLRAGETSVAIVGAASLLIAPEQTLSLSKWGMMAPDGRTKAFDASADGWVRGEGAGALVLKRLADALGDGDRVHAVIRGTAVNQDGRSAALTAPNGRAQRAVVRAALANARVAAARVSYVEAHGTGTSVGDPIELEALLEEIGRAAGAPCHVGTIKANIGHLEAAAGVAGIIKVVLALKHERIPPHLHFQTLNPLVSLDGTRLRIAPDGAAWPAARELRVAGVSSFGFGGTNAHVILEEAPRLSVTPAPDDGPWLLSLSAHAPVALRQMADDVAGVAEAHGLRDLAWTLASHDALRYRVAVVADRADALGASLRDALQHDPTPVDAVRDVAFVFSGHGSQWPAMGRESLAHDAVFAEAMSACDAIVRAYAGWSPLEVLQQDALASRLDDTAVFQPVIVALQLALADSWMAAGQVPVAVLGHSVGELSAACIAGAITRTEALHLAVDRGRLMQSMAPNGAMLAAQGDEATMRRVVAQHPGVVIAGENAPGMLTVSGGVDAIEPCQAALEHDGVLCHRVRVTRAFHSPAMSVAAAALAAQYAAFRPRETTIPLYSSVTGGRIAGTQLTAAYWERNARDAVRFADASTALFTHQDAAVIEVSPHPVLLAPRQETLAALGLRRPVVPTWRRGRGERATRLASMGGLWCAGVPVDGGALFDEPGERLPLPPYRWQRRHAWAGAPLPMGRMGQGAPHEQSLPGRMTDVSALGAVLFEATIRASDEILREHRVSGRVVVPGTLLLLAVLEAATRSAPPPFAEDRRVELRDVVLDRALAIEDGAGREVQITLRTEVDGRESFSVTSRAIHAPAGTAWDRHASGTIVRPTESRSPGAPFDASAARGRCVRPEDVPSVYAALERSGIALGAAFQLVRTLNLGEGEAMAELQSPIAAGASLAEAAARLDAALHAVGPMAFTSDGDLWLPVGYETVQITDPARIAASYLVLRVAPDEAEHRIVDVQLFDRAGDTIGELRGVRVQRTQRSALARQGIASDSPLLTMRWDSCALSGGAANLSGECWLVLEDAPDGATPIADAIESAGGTSVRWARDGAERAIDAASRLDAMAPSLLASCSGIVFAWGLDQPATPRPASAVDGVVAIAGSAVSLLRALVTRAIAPPRGVLMVTRGAVDVRGDVLHGRPEASALWGLRNSAAAEHPELSLRALDLPTHLPVTMATDVVAECSADDREPRVARRGGERLVARLAARTMSGALRGSASFALMPPTPPTIEALTPVPIPRREPERGTVEITVEAAGLNFRDVLGVLGMVGLPGNALGGECAGVVSAVGAGVTSVALGDRVVAFALGGLRTHVHVSEERVAPMPAWMSFAHASALPVAYLTAYYALVRVARVQPGDRVLINSAAGGVGIAAVHIAHWLGATVVGTAGSEEKRAYLRSIGVAHVFDSRAVSFQEALRDGGGRGTLDVVLNSLSDDFIPASLDALAAHGRFVEIGKRGIWSEDAVRARRPDVSYTVFDLSELPSDVSAGLGTMLRDVLALVDRGVLPPLPTTPFALSECVDAFRFMAQARQTGKIAIVMAPTPGEVRADGRYVVTGALGALGRGVVERLFAAGARSFLLLARRAPDVTDAAWLASLTARGGDVLFAGVDVGDRDALATALADARRESSPLRGIVHTAGVTDDGALVSQHAERLGRVVRGKVDGAWHLDQLTRQDPLDFFVLFSSASGVLGWPGQSTYSAANTALDLVASIRRASGRPAVSMQWGTWAGGGMASRVEERARRFDASGMRAFAPDEALDLMMSLRTAAEAQVLVMRADWNAFATARPQDARLYDAVLSVGAGSASADTPPGAPASSLLAEWLMLPGSLQADAVRDAMTRLAARALGLPVSSHIDGTRPLRELGLDSLMAVELRNAIGAAIERTLPATLLFEYPSVDTLSAFVATLLRASPMPPVGRRDDDGRAPSDVGVAAMTDNEAEAMLLEELSAARFTSPRTRR